MGNQRAIHLRLVRSFVGPGSLLEAMVDPTDCRSATVGGERSVAGCFDDFHFHGCTDAFASARRARGQPGLAVIQLAAGNGGCFDFALFPLPVWRMAVGSAFRFSDLL